MTPSSTKFWYLKTISQWSQVVKCIVSDLHLVKGVHLAFEGSAKSGSELVLWQMEQHNSGGAACFGRASSMSGAPKMS